MTILDQLSITVQSVIDLAKPLVQSPEFLSFGLLILFVWTAIPSQIPLSEVFTVPLLALGVSPILLIIVATLGTTTGNFILYLIGKGTFRIVKGKPKKRAEAENLLHKFRLPIFLATPFLFFIGDLVVVVAGFQRVGFLKILPFLLIGEFVRQTLSIYAILGLIKLPEILELSFI